MALEAERPLDLGSGEAVGHSGAGERLLAGLRWIGQALLATGGRIRRWHSNLPIPRYISAKLYRRIIVSNLFGLFILFVMMLYLSLHHGWLLDAKVETVRTLARITADALAYRAVNDKGAPLFDPNRLPDPDGRGPARKDRFALELPLSPPLVARTVKKLIGPTNMSAWVYAPNGSIIIDNDTVFQRKAAPSNVVDDDASPRLKNFWTRAMYWLINKELQVYREIGTRNGFLYPEVKAAAEQGIPNAILLLNAKGEQIVSMAQPIKAGNRVLGVLLLNTRPGEIDESLWEERRLILQIAAFAFIAAIISSILLSRTVAGPMSRLSETAEQVTHNISARQDLPDFSDRRDEVGKLGRAFQSMTAALYRRIEASEKFAADVAHELKNPLAAARSTAEALCFAKTDEERRALVGQVQEELKRLNRLINDVSNASRLDAELARQTLVPVSVRDVLEGVVRVFRDILGDDTRRVTLQLDRVDSDAAFVVDGDDGRLAQVFTNLVDNALSFSPEGGTVTLNAKVSSRHIEVLVEDEGPGIPPDRLEMIFDRFYSDRPATDSKRGKNSGLGLSISKEIIIAHGGAIAAENRPASADRYGKPAGARFIVRLPRSAITGVAGLGRRT